jgi:hypothetical protein
MQDYLQMRGQVGTYLCEFWLTLSGLAPLSRVRQLEDTRIKKFMYYAPYKYDKLLSTLKYWSHRVSLMKSSSRPETASSPMTSLICSRQCVIWAAMYSQYAEKMRVSGHSPCCSGVSSSPPSDNASSSNSSSRTMNFRSNCHQDYSCIPWMFIFRTSLCLDMSKITDGDTKICTKI